MTVASFALFAPIHPNDVTPGDADATRFTSDLPLVPDGSGTFVPPSLTVFSSL